MGRYQRPDGVKYKQESPAAYMGIIANLLGQQGKAQDKIVGAVDQYGESRARGRVAELMGTDEFKAASPLDAQAMVQSRTNGRSTGDDGREMVKNMLGMKTDVLNNENKVTAAETLFGNQLKRDSINNAASMAQTNASNKSREKMYGNKSGVNKLLGTTEEQVLGIQEELKNIAMREEVQKNSGMVDTAEQPLEDFSDQKKALNTKLQFLLSGSNLNAGAQGSVSNQLFPKLNTGKTPKTPSQQLTQSTNQQTTDTQRQALDGGVDMVFVNGQWRFADGVVASDANIAKRYGKK